jgi:uncharacterized protein YjbI with pentapeptide repeats
VNAVETQVNTLDANNQAVLLDGQTLLDINLRGANASFSDFSGATINSSNGLPDGLLPEDARYPDILRSDFSYGIFEDSDFVDANITDTEFGFSTLRNAIFDGATINSTLTSIAGVSAGTSFIGANLAFSRFENANLNGTYLSASNVGLHEYYLHIKISHFRRCYFKLCFIVVGNTDVHTCLSKGLRARQANTIGTTGNDRGSTTGHNFI